MRSYLTRSLFRQILHNVLFLDSRGLARPLVQCCSRYIASPHSVHRRSLFGFSRKPQRVPKPVDLDPGFEVMAELSQMLSQGTRPPSSEKLAQAFCDFFHARMGPLDQVEDIQALHTLNTFGHLQETYHEEEGFGIPDETLRVALQALGNVPRGKKQYPSHLRLAQEIFAELGQRSKKIMDDQEHKATESQENKDTNQGNVATDGQENQALEGQEPHMSAQILFPFLRAIANCGDPLLARETTERFWDSILKHNHGHVWLQILGGFAREDNTEEVSKTIEIMQQHNVPYSPKVHQFITLYYAQRGDVEKTKKWYKYPIANSQPPTFHTESHILIFCIRHNELEWGDPTFKAMLERNPTSAKEWSLVFQWAAAKGKGVDEIERMMKIMIRRTAEGGTSLQPDVEMINRLVELANGRNDPYTAERYVALGGKWGIQPDAQTFLLQLEYRIKVGDLDGARASYANLQAQEITENKDIPMINKLIVALCAEKHPNFAAIKSLVGDLNERKGRFEPETVATLSKLHLQRGEMADLVDLLHTYAFHYGLEHRALVRNVLVDFCLDQSKSTARVWDAYSVLRQIFDETSTETRTRIMNEFFDRSRSDMACHVFGHMRQKAIRAHRPDINTYIACFEGIARTADYDSLQTVHNMMKLDVEIEPNTKLYNSLMLAHTACGNPRRSLGYWADIIHSREGPTYNSIQIALRACEKVSFGDRPAREIWDQLKKYEIELTKDIYIAYIGAMAGQGLFSEAAELVYQAEKEVGYPPDELM